MVPKRINMTSNPLPKLPPAISFELIFALVHDADRAAYAIGRAHQQRRARVAQ